MKQVTKTICTALLSTVCAGAAVAGGAESRPDATLTTAPASATPLRLDSGSPNAIVRQLTVSYADLNLERAEDRATLQQRLEDAADRVCGSRAGSLYAFLGWKGCYQDALDRAVAAVQVRTEQQGELAFTRVGFENGA